MNPRPFSMHEYIYRRKMEEYCENDVLLEAELRRTRIDPSDPDIIEGSFTFVSEELAA